MSELMEYKGYQAKISYDADDKIFVGNVIGLNDTICFHATSVDDLEKNFRDNIEDYLEMCKKIGKQPEKTYNGVFNVRVAPETHKLLAIKAAALDETINQFVNEAIKEKIAMTQ